MIRPVYFGWKTLQNTLQIKRKPLVNLLDYKRLINIIRELCRTRTDDPYPVKVML